MRRYFVLSITISAMVFMAALIISEPFDTSLSHDNNAAKVGVTRIIEAAPLAIEIEPTPEITEESVSDPDAGTEAKIMYYTEDEVVMMAKLLYRECRGVPSDTQKACVAWTVCNRVDDERFAGSTIAEVMTVPNQFAYYRDTPVTDELYALAQDVLARWNAERNGEVSVGRVLPKDYTHYTGDGVRNYFRNAYKGSYSIWNYSLPSPYES